MPRGVQIVPDDQMEPTHTDPWVWVATMSGIFLIIVALVLGSWKGIVLGIGAIAGAWLINDRAA